MKPRVIVVFGLSGSGKSYVARILHEEWGYEWLRSDVIRKELAGIPANEEAKAEFGGGIYTESMTEKVYNLMVSRAKEVVERGGKVVLDATFLKRWQRKLVKEAFPDTLFVWVYADEEVVRRRLKDREDVSDADFGIYLKQKEVFEPPEEVRFVKVNNTDLPREEVIKNLTKAFENIYNGLW